MHIIISFLSVCVRLQFYILNVVIWGCLCVQLFILVKHPLFTALVITWHISQIIMYISLSTFKLINAHIHLYK